MQDESLEEKDGFWLPTTFIDEKHSKHIQSAIGRIIVALRLALRCIDDVIEGVEDDWILREILLQTL